MELIKKAIRQIANEEYERANKKFPLFNSDHEGLAVLEEEMAETETDWKTACEIFDYLKMSVFKNEVAASMTSAENLKDHAINACAECIQVIAMCDKFIESHTKRSATE